MRLAPAIVVLVVACAPAEATRCADTTVIAAVTAEPIDVDSADRGQTVHVTLEAMDGTLVARTGLADRDQVDDEDRACPTEPWQLDTPMHATWDAGDTVLAARTADASANGTPGGWIGMLLPWSERTAIAIRSWTVDWGERGLGERDDELVTITLPDVAVAPIYVPGGRLRLMGMIAGHAILLLSARDGTHHVVAIDGAGTETARSEAVTPRAEMLESTGTSGTELGLPYASPVDATTIAFVCTESSEICTVRFDGASLALTHTGTELADGGLLLSGGTTYVTRGDDCRAVLGSGAFAPCDEGGDDEGTLGLPIDGVLGADLEGDVWLIEARMTVAIEPRDPDTEEDVHDRGLAGVVLLDAPEGGANGVAFDLLVRGEHVAISYTRVSDTDAGTQRRGLGLALPAGSVVATPATMDGTPAHRVRIHTTFPIHYSHDCWQGFWVVRAWSDGGGEAFTSTYAEYGYCE